MVQKVIVVGNSLAVTIPKDTAEKLHIKAGDKVEVAAHPATGVLTVQLQGKRRAVDPDVLTWTNAFIDKNRKLLERLADK